MPKHTFFLVHDQARQNAARAVMQAPEGCKVAITSLTRSDKQNKRLWAMLGKIAEAKPEGRDHSQEVWKSVFMAALGIEQVFAPTLDNRSVVPLGYRSSQLSASKFNDLFLIIEEYAARHGIALGDEQPYEFYQNS